MRTTDTDDQPQLSQPLEYPDRGIIRDLGGRWGWRFWWPLALWTLTSVSIATFWPDGTTTAPIPLLIGGVIAVILIWVLGARPAIQNGHNRTLVRMIATVIGILVSAGSIVVGAIARVLEATTRGNDNARIFISGFGKGEDHTQLIGVTESLYIDHGLQVLAVVTLLGWLLVGRVERKK